MSKFPNNTSSYKEDSLANSSDIDKQESLGDDLSKSFVIIILT